MSSTQSATEWLAALSPWPGGGFGTERMRHLLSELGDPQRRYPAVHVVGTNGKSTTTRMTEELLTDAGLFVGAPEDEEAPEHARLIPGEADAVRVGHQRLHALDQPAEVVVERLDLLCA